MARDGSGLRRLLAQWPASVAWAPGDGQLAAGMGSSIELVTVSSGATTNLVTLPGRALVSTLSWSPDGRRLAANVVHNPTSIGATSSELVVVDTQTGSTISLGPIDGTKPIWSSRNCLGWVSKTVNISCPGTAPLSLPPFPGTVFSWSPDGSHYGITSTDDSDPGAIVVYRANGTDPVNLGDNNAYPIAYAGDGSSIVFEQVGDPSDQLWDQPVSGGQARALGVYSAYAVNGVDDGVVAVAGPSGHFRSILTLRASDPTPHSVAGIATSSTTATSVAWSTDGARIAVSATPAG